MTKKRYTVQTACPQCGCSSVAHLSEEEVREKFGDVPNVDMACQVLSLNFADPISLKLTDKEKRCQECGIPLAASWILSTDLFCL